jgi:DNA-directed RNA polymerase specialized sigma24 family protein
MVLAVLDRGQSAVAVGRIGNHDPRFVRRRVRRVYDRISSREFQFVAQRVDSWGGTRRRVALASFLHGMSLRQAASSLGLSVHLVRQHIAAIRNQMDLLRQASGEATRAAGSQRAA